MPTTVDHGLLEIMEFLEATQETGPDDPTRGPLGSGITIFIADAQRLVGEILGSALAAQPDFEVIQEFPTTGAGAVDLALRLRPGVSLIDYRMPDLKGSEVAKRILAAQPERKLILISWLHGTQEIEDALDSGAVGFFTKSLSMDQLAEGIRRAHMGESPVYLQELEALFSRLSTRADEAAHAVQSLGNLSPREITILGLLSLDYSIKDAAAELTISPLTVKMHIRNMLRKTGCLSHQEVLVKARFCGLIRN